MTSFKSDLVHQRHVSG